MADKDLYYSTDGELFNAEDVGALGLSDGDIYYQGERKDIKASALLSDIVVTYVLENLDEGLSEEVGDLANGNLHVSEEGESELLELIKAWADKHVQIGCWGITNVEQKQYFAAESRADEDN
jgi:hypothetical protein